MNDQAARGDRLRRAARYRLARSAETGPERGSLDPADVAAERASRAALDARNMATIAKHRIEVAERDGSLANNPYAGKPLPDNDGTHDPDWWIRRFVEREQLTGLGPPALMLRKEDAELDERLDEEIAEDRVRAIVASFNARILDARRQLMGGPPVVTALRDVDGEVTRWAERRATRLRSPTDGPVLADSGQPPHREHWFRRHWFRRRR